MTQRANPSIVARTVNTIPAPIGISDFRTLRERGFVYIDKSHLISELIDRENVPAVLLPRPRRFGKTLNMSMLRCYFEKGDQDTSHLFEGLHIWRAGEKYRAHFRRYPVIYLTLKNIKTPTWAECYEGIRKEIEVLFGEHRYLEESGHLSESQRMRFQAVLTGNAESILYRHALGDLCEYLHRHHGEKAILLIDEYDAPIHVSYVQGYAKEALEFFRGFLTSGLKDNVHLSRAVLTGILRIARESIFSDLNNLGVYTLLRREFSSCFGFTESEVQALLEKAGRAQCMDLVRAWYNGYFFGGQVIYNPWSILNFVANEEISAQAYWLNTSSNDLVKHLLERHAEPLGPVFSDLLEGKSVERSLSEHLVLNQLETSKDALFGLLVFAGYLNARMIEPKASHLLPTYKLSIPNLEVRQVYVETFGQWLDRTLSAGGGDVDRLLWALLAGDAVAAERHLSLFVRNMLSYHDAGIVFPEQVYHAFVLGLLAAYEGKGYRVRSNRESGLGRPDVLILPVEAGKPGAVLELKVVKEGKRAPEKALKAALAQIDEQSYAAEVEAAGARPIQKWAVAFDGKKVWVRAGKVGKG